MLSNRISDAIKVQDRKAGDTNLLPGSMYSINEVNKANAEIDPEEASQLYERQLLWYLRLPCFKLIPIAAFGN